MRDKQYPITMYREKSFGGLFEKLPQVPPFSFFLTLFLLLSVITAAAGYRGSAPGADSQKEVGIELTLRPSHNEATMAMPEDNMGVNDSQRYAFDAGRAIVDRSFKEKQKIASEIGLPFHVEITTERVTMTRLYLGTFPAKKALSLYGKIKKKFPGSFVMQNRHDQTIAVFGGSFYFPEAAKKEKERLVRAGYAAKEIPAQVSLPLYAAYIGDFPSFQDGEAFRQQLSKDYAKEMSLVAVR